MKESGTIQAVKASPAERELVLTLVDWLLRELEDSPEEFQGIDRDRVLRDLART